MQKSLFAASALFLALAWLTSRALEVGALPTSLVEEPDEPSVVGAAQDFLEALDEEGRRKATFAFESGVRFRWHFVPETKPPREGITLEELDEPERRKAQDLLRSALSKLGYERAEQVRELEAVLAEIEGAGARFRRDPLLYYVSVFGKPDGKGRWGFRFEGHHLSLNFTLDGERIISATPLFYGANPAEVPHGPKKGLRVLGDMEDIARRLVKSLDESQRKVALGEDPEEVKGTMSARYGATLPEGVTGADMSDEQKKLLRRLISEYTGNLEERERKAIENAIEKSGLDRVYFSWRGGTERFEGHSYIVHGPTFIISYANFQNGARHIHAALRDRMRDFGLEGQEG